MNTTAVRLGLTKTHFLNPTGLDVSLTASGGYGSAYDVARLAAAFFLAHPNFFEQTSRNGAIWAEGRELAATSTSMALFDIPGFIGAKTGFTDLAGGNLVAVFDLDINYPVVVVALGSTREGRFIDVRTLINAMRERNQP
jgi:D-alanyl-D-alanine carboxypeptidase